MSAPRLLFLIPYFGSWPFWMPFFLQSCRYNPDVQWLFFTDCGVPSDAPENVHFRVMTFTDYCTFVSTRLGIPFQPSSPYKLCDLKPALGYVHADDLAGFDFWGFSDIDLVYGDLRAYFTGERLTRFDLLSTHARRVSGHLCLLRNDTSMREAFMLCSGWKEILSSNEHYAFDERSFSRLFLRFKNWPAPLQKVLNAFNPLWRRSAFEEAYSTPNGRVRWHDGGFSFPQSWIWRCGRLYNDKDGDKQFPYVHFIGWKCDTWPSRSKHELMVNDALARQSAWCITAEGFREVES